jgi:hypothetical protein
MKHQKNIETFAQDTDNPILEYILSTKISSVMLAQNVSRGTFTVTLTPGHGMQIGEYLEIWQAGLWYQGEVSNVNANIITLLKPVYFAFTTSAGCYRTSINMNVNGSVIPVLFTLEPTYDISFDIYSSSVSITDNIEMDDSKFGGISSLTNGVLVGKINPNILHDSYLYNLKNNGCFNKHSFVCTYTDKAGGGLYGFNAKKDFRTNNGSVPRVKGTTGEAVSIIIRDDLSTLSSFVTVIHGHKVL